MPRTAKAALTTGELGKAINAAMRDVNWVSEGDSTPEFVSVAFADTRALTGKNLLVALKALYVPVLGNEPAALVMGKLTAASLKDLATAGSTDPDEVAFARGFAAFRKLAQANLTHMVTVKIGPQEYDGSLAADQGEYARFMLGRTCDGKLAGIQFSVVET